MSVSVLIVDDSRTMRAFIRRCLEREHDIVVVGEAADPYEARDAIKSLSPDVVTLDVEMPRMNGLAFLKNVMRLRPTPIVMISSLTTAGADITLEALERGAVDFVAKPVDGDFESAFVFLADKVRAAAGSNVGTKGTTPSTLAAVQGRYRARDRIVAIGASTGGVEAISTFVSALPSKAPPVVITQHMPAKFTRSFAKRLDANSHVSVIEAEDGTPIELGHVYLAPGGQKHFVVTPSRKPMCRLIDGEARNGHRPSVDTLFESVSAFGHRAVAILFTGMGRDGATGIGAIKDAGGLTIAQDRASSTVYGMARVAKEEGHIELEMPLADIAPHILQVCGAYY